MSEIDDLYARARRIGIAEDDLPRVPPPEHRRIALVGGLNFRDLGGYPTLDGGTTRWNLLFRSDHLNGLTDADAERVEAIGLRRVHDFRLDVERARQPSRLPEGETAPEVRCLAMSDTGQDSTMVDVIQNMLAGKIALPEPTYWDDMYVAMVRGARSMFVDLVASLAEPDALPALFHCTGGKDRTGLAGVLVLQLLGVDRDTAIDDFLLTNLYRTPSRAEALAEQLAAVGIDVVGALPVLGVTRSAIERALSVIDDEFGGPEAYVLDGSHDPAALTRLRAALVE